MRYLKILTIIFSLSLTGCKTIESRGQFVTQEEIVQLKTNKLSKSEVVNLIGTPTYVPKHTPNTWFYIQRSMIHQAWFKPKIDSQKVVKIEFDNNKKVKNVIVEEDKHNSSVGVSSDFTKTQGTEKSGWQKFVKNLGRFNKSKQEKSRKKTK